MEQRISNLIASLKRRNIDGIYVDSKDEARERIKQLILKSATVGVSGSRTLDELGIVALLEASDYEVFNQYRPGISREQSLQMRNLGSHADYFLTSCNAISEDGELVFFSGYGHRTSGIANSDNVIVVCGLNKIVLNLDQALKRSREHATVLNCKRLDWKSACLADGLCHKDICLAPEYKRMCCQVLVIESEINPERLKVIIVGEELGF
ncbi:MAG: lactate utilization protein [Candidatus Omnitrophica bacterium]|nr:lactate utilization protein [Candidatus Omnitrophota bacterium]MDD5690295.1 lactate utilization protein [Candidatus Omnitrophota bacterium]